MKDDLRKSVDELILRISEKTTEVKNVYKIALSTKVDDLHEDALLKLLSKIGGFNAALEINGYNPEDFEIDAYMDILMEDEF